MKIFRSRKFFNFLIFSILFLVLSEGSFMVRHKRLNPQTLAAEFNQEFIKSDINLKNGLKWISTELKDKGVGILASPDFIKMLEAKHKDYGLSFFIFENNELVLWSNNSIPIYRNWIQSADKGLVELGNGWYFYRTIPYQNFTIAGFYTVKTNFKYQNRFLVNDFHQNLSRAEDVFFLSHKRNDSFEILDSEHDYAFSVELRSETALITLQRGIWILSMLFAVASVFLFLFGSYKFFSFKIEQGNPLVNLLGFGAALVAFRSLLLIFQVPSVFYQGELFSPTLYAKSILLPSLGDLLLHLIFSGIFIFFTYSQLKRVHISKAGLPKAVIAAFFLLGLVVVFCWITIDLIRSLVIDSQLNLDVSTLFDLNIFSVIGFFTIAGILFSFYFAVHLLFKISRLLISNDKGYYLFLLIAAVILFVVDFIAGDLNVLKWLLFAVALVVFEVFNRAPAHKVAFTPLILALFLFSIISTFALSRFNTIREHERRKTLALRLATEQDHIAEYLFYDLEAALKSDNQLRNLIIKDPYNTNAIRQYLVHHYFYDFWGNYLFQVMVCRPEEMLLIRPQNFEMSCLEYFDAYISAFGKPTISPSFIYLENYTGRNSYIARLNFDIPSPGGNTITYHLILEFDAKHVIRDMGLPELLIDDRININRDLVNYSYATYFEGSLINKFGPYIYNIDLSTYGTFNNQFEFFIFDEYEHLVYTKNSETQIIISKPVKTFLEGIAPLSFLFILLLTLIILFLIATGQKDLGNWLQLTFKRRVQAFMVGIVIVSVLAIGGVSTWFIVNFHNNKNRSIIHEKSTSVLVDLESYLAFEEILPGDYDYFLSDLLINLNSVLFTDINLFGTDGFLVASSRPRIFEEEIVSRKMNPMAFAALRAEQKSQFIHKERIGNLEFYSSYVPLRNNQHDLLGYINLPYFAKQSELRNEISHFVLAFVNINLLLLFFAVVMALIVSNHITRPLQLIRDNISRLQFGKTGPKIDWARRDEIGQMIIEYNRMIDELAISADRLARSEREFAWREMAKQVAHEIKNPLTPMRLSIQHLEKAWHESVPDWEKRLKRFSKTMIEQIDHLSFIAGEFSDFAKLPSGKNGLINLREFAPELLNLYQNIDNVVIELKMPRGKEPLLVIADKNQLHRVFNNLIRNSIQAYPKEQTAVIQVIYEKNHEFVMCHVRDFGCGISDKLKPNIFSPNFTTKTGGMGLGLSMVKTIVESMGGAISFQSKENEGTTFTFTLPVCQEEQKIDEL